MRHPVLFTWSNRTFDAKTMLIPVMPCTLLLVGDSLKIKLLHARPIENDQETARHRSSIIHETQCVAERTNALA